MWVRKSEKEIQDYLDWAEAKKRSVLGPFLFSLMTVIVIVGSALAYSAPGFVFINPSGRLNLLPVFAILLLFVGLFSLALYKQRKSTVLFYLANDTLLCRECKQPSANPSGQCKCGGQLEPFGFYSWE
jgi:hydrogenase-4 membrane subunit HyfE